jgi:hypothetical protein
LSDLRSSLIRALTSRFTRVNGRGLASGKRIVPFEVSNPLRSIPWTRANDGEIG